MMNFEATKNELAEKYRIPLVPDIYPREYYVSALAYFEPDHYMSSAITTLMPEEKELELFSKYIQYRNERYLSPHFIEKMKQQGPVDIDPGVNTFVFLKSAERGWLYRMASWQYGPSLMPGHDSSVRYETLLEILDHVNDYSGGTPNPHWEKFKEEHHLLD